MRCGQSHFINMSSTTHAHRYTIHIHICIPFTFVRFESQVVFSSILILNIARNRHSGFISRQMSILTTARRRFVSIYNSSTPIPIETHTAWHTHKIVVVVQCCGVLLFRYLANCRSMSNL